MRLGAQALLACDCRSQFVDKSTPVLPGGGEAGSGQPGAGEGGEGEGGSGFQPGNGGLRLEQPVELEPLAALVPATVVVVLPSGWDQREYVWGPDYVDELAWQVDKDGTPYYALLDANYNVMAIVAGADVPLSSGDPAGTPTIPAGAVVEQYVWSPYGELLSRDVFDRRVNPDGTPTPTTGQLVTDAGAARPPSGSDPGSPGTAGASLPGIRNKVGHQGLFFERFDGLNTDPPLVPTDTTATTPTAPAGRGKGLYYNRWRWYDAQAGRFVSEDMNGAGMAGSESLAFHGDALDVSIEAYGGSTQFGDGLNLFAFLLSNPIIGNDPLGLDYDPFDEVDDIIGAIQGERAAAAVAAMSYIGTTVNVALMLGEMAWSMVPGSGLVDLTLILAAGNEVTWQDLASAGFDLLGPLSKIASPFIKMTSNYAAKGVRLASNLTRNVGRIPLRVLQKLCFVAGTTVLMEDGSLAPIETLEIGDDVVSWQDPSEQSACFEVDPKAWCILRLEMLDLECKPAAISLLRSIEMLPGHSPRVGSTLQLSMPELGLVGRATVKDVLPCPSRLAGATNGFVSGTFQREGNETVDIYVDTQVHPIGTTAAHPFWSIDRGGWVAARDLAIGETLQSLDGPLAVVMIDRCAQPQTVYNLEIYGHHTYFVTDSAVWVHNGYKEVAYEWVVKYGANHGMKGQHKHQLSDAIGSELVKRGLDDATVSISKSGQVYADGRLLGLVWDIIQANR